MDSGSLYDQFSNHEAEPLPVREVGRFANRQDNTQPYVGRLNEPKKVVSNAQEKDLSYYAWNRRIRFAQPISSFEQSVNIAFKGVITGENFDDMRDKYVKLYRKMMGEL